MDTFLKSNFNLIKAEFIRFIEDSIVTFAHKSNQKIKMNSHYGGKHVKKFNYGEVQGKACLKHLVMK